MAIKKSELYASLWASCDELRGGMDASQYKDYILVLLFIKYVSDKYAGDTSGDIVVPTGASFADMCTFKGNSEIGDLINKQIIAPLANANGLNLGDMPDFNDATKLGDGKEKVDRLTNLIAIFEKPELDFSKNRADGDDILGDAYEYLMRHFATESGKSKGQFYTPAEVSRVVAKLLEIGNATTTQKTTVYDPTCGSGSLLLRVASEAHTELSLYGQEKDASTSGLARMNMILHNNATAEIVQGNTLSNPKFLDEQGKLKTFDYVVANPPFSDKKWVTGVSVDHDFFGRFDTFGAPPDKQGDYAYLLHIVKSMKSTAKAACILPHGVLFRGNAEGAIRQKLIQHGYIKAIIGLPANLFYGTGIPACIIVLDKAHAAARKGIFMVDASRGFIKDGSKNRLREQDIHHIIDVYNKQGENTAENHVFARMVSVAEIEKNEFNLNLPRYIDNSEAEDLQDIEAHLKGGIPTSDIESLAPYWAVCPALKAGLFKPLRNGYMQLTVAPSDVKKTIYAHPQFSQFMADMAAHFNAWRSQAQTSLKALNIGDKPKILIATLSENLLAHYRNKPLIDAYTIYQLLMDYWESTMQDDAYLIGIDGWKAETKRIIEIDKKTKKEKDKGWLCDILPKPFIVARYFAAQQTAIDDLQATLEQTQQTISELLEENSGDDGVFAQFDKINKAEINARLKDLKQEASKDAEAKAELALLNQWLTLNEQEATLKKELKEAETTLDNLAYQQYPKLTEAEIKTLVVDDKWLTALNNVVNSEVERVSQQLTQRVRELAERYAQPLPQLTQNVADYEAKVNAHLAAMGFSL